MKFAGKFGGRQRACLKRISGGGQYLLMSAYCNIREDQLPALQEALDANKPLWKGYLMIEMLYCICTQDSKKEKDCVINSWCLKAAQSEVKQLGKVAKNFPLMPRETVQLQIVDYMLVSLIIRISATKSGGYRPAAALPPINT